jgi:hypothetical protein
MTNPGVSQIVCIVRRRPEVVRARVTALRIQVALAHNGVRTTMTRAALVTREASGFTKKALYRSSGGSRVDEENP